MENRKELSTKSKKLLLMQYKSDILNKSSGYYKTENIYPITPKPNEYKIHLKKFIPHFKEIIPKEKKCKFFLSEKQRNNSFIINHINLEKNKNYELEILRKRAKTIKKNCYDKDGNYSAKKRFFFEFYGNNLNNTFEFDEVNNKKEEDKINNNNINDNINKVSIKYHRHDKIKRKKIREIILKSRNIDNYDNENNSNTNNTFFNDKFNTINNDNFVFNKLNYQNYFKDEYNNKDLSNYTFNNIDNNVPYEKISRNKIPLDYNFSTLSSKERFVMNSHNRIKTDIHYPDTYIYNTQSKIIKKSKNMKDIKDIKRPLNITNMKIRNYKSNINKNKNINLKVKNKEIKENKKIKEIKLNKININKKDKLKKRKGTPGKILYDNRFNKDKNTKINTGKSNNLHNHKNSSKKK